MRRRERERERWRVLKRGSIGDRRVSVDINYCIECSIGRYFYFVVIVKRWEFFEKWVRRERVKLLLKIF